MELYRKSAQRKALTDGIDSDQMEQYIMAGCEEVRVQRIAGYPEYTGQSQDDFSDFHIRAQKKITQVDEQA